MCVCNLYSGGLDNVEESRNHMKESHDRVLTPEVGKNIKKSHVTTLGIATCIIKQYED